MKTNMKICSAIILIVVIIIFIFGGIGSYIDRTSPSPLGQAKLQTSLENGNSPDPVDKKASGDTLRFSLKAGHVGPKSLLQVRSLVVKREKYAKIAPKPRVFREASDAFSHLYGNLVMSPGGKPEWWTEDDTYFYYSGGRAVWKINDFTFGCAVKKQTGDIITWNELKFDQPLTE